MTTRHKYEMDILMASVSMELLEQGIKPEKIEEATKNVVVLCFSAIAHSKFRDTTTV